MDWHVAIGRTGPLALVFLMVVLILRLENVKKKKSRISALSIKLPDGQCPLPLGPNGRPAVWAYFQKGTPKDYYGAATHRKDRNAYVQDYVMLKHLWRDSWARNGWDPVVLTLSNATHHPLYEQLWAAVLALPTLNNKYYETQCYLRWLAIAAAGGGFMVDYDVMNLGFRPPPSINCSLTTYDPYEISPALLSGGPDAFAAAAASMIAFQPSQVPVEVNTTHTTTSTKVHMSDQQMMQMGVIPSQRWSTPLRRMLTPGWANASLVHFVHAQSRKPRWYWILKSGWCYPVPQILSWKWHQYETKFKALTAGQDVVFHSCLRNRHGVRKPQRG